MVQNNKTANKHSKSTYNSSNRGSAKNSKSSYNSGNRNSAKNSKSSYNSGNRNSARNSKSSYYSGNRNSARNSKSSYNSGNRCSSDNKSHKARNIFALLVIVALCFSSYYAYNNLLPKYVLHKLENPKLPDWIDVQIIPMDGVSRDGSKLDGFNDVVVHYVGNPGTTAQQNHDFYCNPESEVSSHFIVGLEGEIIQCIPLDEQSAASNWRNHDTISIEVCHPDETGIFNKKTYLSLVKLVAWLTDYGYLTNQHIIRHYDVTEKECPIYYVRHEDAWLQFKKDVKEYR